MTGTPVAHVETDIVIVGSGFGGSLMALTLRQRGQRVALIERGRHPRFAIGESSTPLANLLLEELADRYDLPRIRTFSKWGTWQRAHPEVACGLKRGFTFFFHKPGEPFADTDDHHRQLMVAASPFDHARLPARVDDAQVGAFKGFQRQAHLAHHRPGVDAHRLGNLRVMRQSCTAYQITHGGHAPACPKM
jgi:glycine/D-amino acid oxidase-like deaminating enzyme